MNPYALAKSNEEVQAKFFIAFSVSCLCSGRIKYLDLNLFLFFLHLQIDFVDNIA
jgi:hypothetical protein